jgi:hypothetical protein
MTIYLSGFQAVAILGLVALAAAALAAYLWRQAEPSREPEAAGEEVEVEVDHSHLH